MNSILISFFAAFGLSYFSIPIIDRIARARRLFDQPNERSAHEQATPRLGGLGLFFGLAFGLLASGACLLEPRLGFALAALLLVFLIGFCDDFETVMPSKKVVFELAGGLLLIYGAGIRIDDLHGFLGFWALPEAVSVGLTLLTIVGTVNAVNLIDGVNGLAGSLCALVCAFFGGCLWTEGRTELLPLAMATIGATMGFLRFNLLPRARVFMGDGGALPLGFVCAALAIAFLQKGDGGSSIFERGAAPAIALAALIVPIFDTLRVFAIRIWNGKSPFWADRNHLHHLLLDLGLTHLHATAALVGLNAALLGLVVAFQNIGSELLISSLFAAMTAVAFGLKKAVARRSAAARSMARA